MGRISEIFNFDNIGSKMKTFAKWSCWISILLIWIAAPISFIVLVTDKWTVSLCWVPIVSALLGSVAVWVGSWTMYAFGEFVEKTSENERNTKQILMKLKEKDARKAEEENECQPKDSVKEQPQAPVINDIPADEANTFSDTFWICGKCKTKKLNTRDDCWSCGNPK